GNKVNLPYSLRPQGHDIIRTWTFYTIVRSFLHEKNIPWENIFITGNVMLKGEKMSKSKGNVVAPQGVLENYGADALRYWASSSKLGEDMEYQEKDVVAGKRLINKLSNATNFVFMNLKSEPKRPKELEKADIEFLGRLNEVIKSSTEYFPSYEYNRAKSDIEKFFWNDFCDNYLESVKKIIYQGSGNEKQSVNYTLYHSLLTILKLMAPIMPFITEDIYQTHFKKYEKHKSIHISPWPEFGKEKSKGYWDVFKDNLSKIKQFKSEKQLPLNAQLENYKVTLPSADHKVIFNTYENRFIATSGAILIDSGKDFKIVEIKSYKAGTEPNL
ncbi:class I tRNA ligase family protein, partial [Candidatus Pacearchaeota archaeon]|nr:class I tRNA ligase family protein [Candidatus Pacearchaeota archaeon]